MRPTLEINNGTATLILDALLNHIYPTALMSNTQIQGTGTVDFTAGIKVVTATGRVAVNNAAIIKASTLTSTAFTADNHVWSGTFIKPDLFYLYSLVQS